MVRRHAALGALLLTNPFCSAEWAKYHHRKTVQRCAIVRSDDQGEWRVVHWSALRGADFLMPLAYKNYSETTKPLMVTRGQLSMT